METSIREATAAVQENISSLERSLLDLEDYSRWVQPGWLVCSNTVHLTVQSATCNKFHSSLGLKDSLAWCRLQCKVTFIDMRTLYCDELKSVTGFAIVGRHHIMTCLSLAAVRTLAHAYLVASAPVRQGGDKHKQY